MQFIFKYLLNSGCKHSNSARDVVEASILDKSAPLHDGKIQIFWRRRVLPHKICSFYKRFTSCYQSAQKNIQMAFSFGQTCKNAEYSWWDQAHLLQRPLVREWQIVSRLKWACQQICQFHSANIQYFASWQGLSLLSPLWWAQVNTKRPKTQKMVSFLIFWHSKLLCPKLIRLWWAWSRDGLLCVIIHACYTQSCIIKTLIPSASSTLFSYIFRLICHGLTHNSQKMFSKHKNIRLYEIAVLWNILAFILILYFYFFFYCLTKICEQILATNP